MATLVGNIRGPGITGVTVSDTAPENPQVGDVWIDNSTASTASASAPVDGTSDASSSGDTTSNASDTVSESATS